MPSTPYGLVYGRPLTWRDALAQRRRVCRAGIVAGQAGRVGLLGGVPGARSLDREALEQARDQLQLDALHAVGRAIDVEGRVAQVYRIEQRQLHVLPVHLVGGQVDLHAVLEPLALEADLVVGEGVRLVARGLEELVVDPTVYGATPLSVMYAAVQVGLGAVEAAGTEAFRVREVGHDVWRDVPGDVVARLPALLTLVEVHAEAAVRARAVRDVQHGGGRAVVLRAMLEFVVLVVARAGGDGQHLRDDVEVGGGEERGLLVAAHHVLAEGGVGVRSR